MKNFIFKSDADFHKIVFNKLVRILDVLREQRIQLDRIEWRIKRIETSGNLQKQVDEFFDDQENTPQDEDKEQD